MASMLYNLLKDLGLGDYVLIVFILALFVDLTPGIKFNPITFILKKIGKAFNQSIDTKIDALDEKIKQEIDNMHEVSKEEHKKLEDKINNLKDENQKQNKLLAEHQKEIDIAEINRLKMEILNFANRISQHHHKFVAEEYHTIMDYHTYYERLIDKYPDLSNGKIDVEYDNIVCHYNQHKDDGDYMF